MAITEKYSHTVGFKNTHAIGCFWLLSFLLTTKLLVSSKVFKEWIFAICESKSRQNYWNFDIP